MDLINQKEKLLHYIAHFNSTKFRRYQFLGNKLNMITLSKFSISEASSKKYYRSFKRHQTNTHPKLSKFDNTKTYQNLALQNFTKVVLAAEKFNF